MVRNSGDFETQLLKFLLETQPVENTRKPATRYWIYRVHEKNDHEQALRRWRSNNPATGLLDIEETPMQNDEVAPTKLIPEDTLCNDLHFAKDGEQQGYEPSLRSPGSLPASSALHNRNLGFRDDGDWVIVQDGLAQVAS